MAEASRDQNRIPVLLGVSAIDAKTPVEIYANDTTHELYVRTSETAPTDTSKVNASLVISNTDSVQASTKTITKTIGSTSYTKTLGLNAGGDVITVSAWS